MKPRLLDLFCGAGGCTKGYQRAGFHVTGVDIEPQPNYCGDEFVQADALTFTWFRDDGDSEVRWVEGHFHAIHASPPCQAYTSLRALGKGAGVGAEDLIAEVRDELVELRLPYVIENVPGAPLVAPTTICGSSLGLGVRRHRLFETNWLLLTQPCAHAAQPSPVAVYGDHPQRTDRSPWRAETLEAGQEAMGIDWMAWRELTQAIPPAYTEHIGRQLMAVVNAERAAA